MTEIPLDAWTLQVQIEDLTPSTRQRAQGWLPRSWRAVFLAVSSATSQATQPSREVFHLHGDVEAISVYDEFDFDEVERWRGRWLEIFSQSRDEVFEDGMEGPFAEAAARVFAEDRREVVEALRKVIEKLAGSGELCAQALRWAGKVPGEETQSERLLLACRMLNSPSPWIRDGACIALASMNDPSALQSLEMAAAREPLPDLRVDLEAVVHQLRA